MIHRALSSIPARPVLIIAPVLVVAVLGVYYWNLHRECTGQAESRGSLIEAISHAAGAGGILRLADVFEFRWEHVKGLAQFKPQYQKRSCPFGWDWSSEERQTIVEAGLLSVLIFFREGNIARVIDFRNDRVEMEEFESGLSPETAVFRVTQMNEDPERYTLSVMRE